VETPGPLLLKRIEPLDDLRLKRGLPQFSGVAERHGDMLLGIERRWKVTAHVSGQAVATARHDLVDIEPQHFER
jgi:hypothetical protein